MKVISFISAIVSLSAILKTAYDRLYSDGEPTADESPLHAQFKKTIGSMERFLESIYVVFGSSVLGMVIDPPDPLWKADEIFNEFHHNYREFLSEFRKLVSVIRESGDDVREKLGNEWFVMDTVGRLFDNGKVEWDQVAIESSLQSANPVLNNQRRFNSHLTEKFRVFLRDEMNAGEFEPIEFVSSILKENEILNIAGARLFQILGSSGRK